MTSKERVLTRERERGRADALNLASRASGMDGTAIIAEEDHIPPWNETAVYTAKMVGWPVRDNGQVYTIIQAHTPDHNPGSRPVDLPAIYSRKNTQDPKKAKPWMAPNGTSGVYIKGDCAIDNGHVWRSIFDGENVWQPTSYPAGWEDLGTVEEVQAHE